VSLSAQLFATKLAFVPDAPTTPKQPSLSKIPSTPGIGERKAPRKLPPATIDARKTNMGQRGNLATMTPQQSATSASMSMRSPTVKTAMTATQTGKSFGTVNGRKIKKAPRHSMSGKRGKKVMPMPHARRTKKAYELMNNSCEFIGNIDSDRIHDGMTTAKAIGGYLAPTTDLEKIAKWNYIQRAEQERRATNFATELSREKQALGGIGTLVGAAGGTLDAPQGNKMEGLGRGVGQGLGWDVGGVAGGASGGGLGAAGGGALAALIAKLTGASPEATASAVTGGIGLGGTLGGAAGYLGGGLLGRRTAKSMMGDPTYDNKKQPQRAQDNTVGDADADAAQMTAP